MACVRLGVVLCMVVVCIALPQQRVNDLYPGWNNSVVSYSGMIPVDQAPGSEMFYWFFEAMSAPIDTPVLLWLNGGPGASDELGNLYEFGPYRLNADGTSLEFNEHSWAQRYHILYVDEPIGVGYSTLSKPQQLVTTLEGMAEQLHGVLEKFFSAYPQYSTQAFFITGESYGGHYIPALASYIISNATNSSLLPRLKGIAVGNGWNVMCIQGQHAGALNHEMGLLNDAEYEEVHGFELEVKAACERGDLTTALYNTGLAFGTVLERSAKMNDEDLRLHHPYNTTLAVTMLNKPSVRAALHANGSHAFAMESQVVNVALQGTNVRDMRPRYLNILNHGVRVLIYQGQMDPILTWSGQEAWLYTLDWEHIAQFIAAKRFSLERVGGSDSYGFIQYDHNLAFGLMFNAGHLVPENQPANSLDMITRFVSDDWPSQ
eukprot:NODE_1252_length_1408_cov_58.128806_g1241_i0.p1 GENE.NODE_1252_length_1408_cov_58.128806_g1241_i0~~NODE_1252_length_1408_cov_58.128806_g1241_i0.p1  ORF type:complete len:447 (+),score=70.97 NODE_1252_length_1408_cov_58.128806_g1241_i0:48-1343(+)